MREINGVKAHVILNKIMKLEYEGYKVGENEDHSHINPHHENVPPLFHSHFPFSPSTLQWVINSTKIRKI